VIRALFLAHAYPRYAGDGVGSFVLRLAVALRGEGVDVHVLAPAAAGLAGDEVMEGVPIRRARYGPRRWESLAYEGTMSAQVGDSLRGKISMVGLLGSTLQSALRLINDEGINLVHAHWWFPGGLVGSAVHAVTGLPLITTLHGSDVRLAEGMRGASSLFRFVGRSSARVTTVSSWLARRAQAMAPNVVPLVAPMPVRTELFYSSNDRVTNRLLFVGKLVDQKGLDHLLRAMRIMKTPATLDVVGAGRVDDRQFVALAESLGLERRVTWHPLLSQEALAELYRRAVIHVIPARDEGLGLTAVESLLSETPVVAFDSGGVSDVVINGETGLLVAPDDEHGLARALDELLENQTERKRMGEKGRARALEVFSPKAVARRYADEYRAALSFSQ